MQNAAEAYQTALELLTAKGFKPLDGTSSRAAFIEEDRVSVFSAKVHRALYGHPKASVTGYRCEAYPTLPQSSSGWHFVFVGA